MKEKRDEVIILRLTKTEKHCIYEKMLGMGIRSLSAYILKRQSVFRYTMVTARATPQTGRNPKLEAVP